MRSVLTSSKDIQKSNHVGPQVIMNHVLIFVSSRCVTAKLVLAITFDKSKHLPKKPEQIVQIRKRCVTSTILSDPKQIYINNARDADKFSDFPLPTHPSINNKSAPTNWKLAEISQTKSIHILDDIMPEQGPKETPEVPER